MRPLALLIVVALLALPALAAKKTVSASASLKKDTTPPTVEHTPLTKHDGVGPLLIDAKIVDDKSAVFEPTLLVRAAGAGPFTRVPMTLKEADHYVAEVPKALLSGDVEYLIEAFDDNGNGPARVGDEAAPLKIVRDVPLVVEPPKPPPPPPPPEDTGPSTLLIASGVAVGAVVLAGLSAGGAFLFYALRPPAPAVVNLQVSGHAPFQAAGAP